MRRRYRRGAILLLPLAVACAMAACGKTEDPEAQQGPETDSSTPPRVDSGGSPGTAPEAGSCACVCEPGGPTMPCGAESACRCPGAPDASVPGPGSDSGPSGTGGSGPGTTPEASVLPEDAPSLPPPPESCASDNDCTPSGLLCNGLTKKCVACVEDGHCAAQHECLRGTCHPYVSCNSSLDCVGAPDGKTICRTSTNRCVQCLGNTDCTGGDVCFQNRCECANLDTDPNNCGICGRVCSNGCSYGECVPAWSECIYETYANCNEYCEAIGQRCAVSCSPFLPPSAVAHCTGGESVMTIIGSTCADPLSVPERCCCAEV
jgi:hypothetical protein